MPLEPRIKTLLAMDNRLRGGKAAPLMPLQRRDEHRLGLFLRLVVRKGQPVDSITHHLVPVEGGQILVRLYRPRPGNLPLHVFFHGGGFCTGTLNQRDDRCQDLAVHAGCVVASVDYRLAPENQYPTAPEDCYAALCWLVDHAPDLGLNPAAVSVGGESAGGNLAAVVSLMARDRNGPRLALQMLEIPATDLTMSQPSIRTFGQGYALTFDAMQDYMQAYLETPERATEPYASPLLAPDLTGLPPAWVMTCEFDPLRDEGEAYATRLEEAGVPVQFQQLAGHIHGSFAFNRLTASAADYLGEAASALRAAHKTALETVTATN